MKESIFQLVVLKIFKDLRKLPLMVEQANHRLAQKRLMHRNKPLYSFKSINQRYSLYNGAPHQILLSLGNLIHHKLSNSVFRSDGYAILQ